MPRALPFGLAMIAATAAPAAEFTVVVPDATQVRVIERSYDCDNGKEMIVVYYNVDPVYLAQFQVEGVSTVAALVLSASGTRYAGGEWILWEKGEREVSLFDARNRNDSPPLTTCIANELK